MTKTCTTLETTNTELGENKITTAATKTLTNDIREKLLGNYPVTKTGLAIGTTKTAVATGALDFTIAGVRYSKAAVAAGTAPGDDVVPQSLYGAVALDIGVDGTIDAIEAADNVTGYATAALAIADIPAAASEHARLGTVTVIKSDGAFTFGTTDLDAANVTTVYTDGETNLEAIGAAIA
jgi:hypothetical protein